jgi:hypothetical protein
VSPGDDEDHAIDKGLEYFQPLSQCLPFFAISAVTRLIF